MTEQGNAMLLFQKKTPHTEKLLAYGFVREADGFRYDTDIAQGQFVLTVAVSGGGVKTRVMDKDSGEEYVLHRAPGAAGAFVGMVREDYERVLADISEKCFEPDIFKQEQTKRLIAYVREKYGDELEYLWEKFSDNAVWRRRDTKKWYAALLTVSRRKLGQDSDELLEIIDLRMKPEALAALVDGVRYFPGYHMNKKHWVTICLDGSVPLEEICARLDESYGLAVK